MTSDQERVRLAAVLLTPPSEGGADESTVVAKKNLRNMSDTLALRSLALKQLAQGLEKQQKALEAANDSSTKQLARIRRSATAAIQKAQHAAKKLKEDVKTIPLPLPPPASGPHETASASASGAPESLE